jgi:hypothetical protein
MNTEEMLALERSNSPLGEAWLDFFLGIANKIDPSLKIGRAKDYSSIQTDNGRRVLASIRKRTNGIKIIFHVDKNSSFEERLANANLEPVCKPDKRHLAALVSTSPESDSGSILKPLFETIIRQAAQEALETGKSR